MNTLPHKDIQHFWHPPSCSSGWIRKHAFMSIFVVGHQRLILTGVLPIDHGVSIASTLEIPQSYTDSKPSILPDSHTSWFVSILPYVLHLRNQVRILTLCLDRHPRCRRPPQRYRHPLREPTLRSHRWYRPATEWSKIGSCWNGPTEMGLSC